MYMARTFMIHTALNWTERRLNDLELWSLAVKYAAWLHNWRPSQQSGFTPLVIAGQKKENHKDLLRSQVWGCPVYVLEFVLQGGKKLH